MPALFDLDNTLIDRLDAFRRWAAAFASERRLGEDAAAWLIERDADGSVPRETFFELVRERPGSCGGTTGRGRPIWCRAGPRCRRRSTGCGRPAGRWAS